MVGWNSPVETLFCIYFFIYEKKCQEENKQLTLNSDDPVQTLRSLSVAYVSGDFLCCTEGLMRKEAFVSSQLTLRHRVTR